MLDAFRSTRMLVTQLILLVDFFAVTILAQVDLIPSDEYLSVLGGIATFRCLTTIPGATIDSIGWLVNGTQPEDLSLRNVSVTFTTAGDGIGSLRFLDLPLEYNNTQVSCSANFSTGQFRSSDTTSILRIFQGLLAKVGRLRAAVENSSISLTWRAPTTQRKVDVYAVIDGYCVGVVNSTSSSTLFSQCGITDTAFSYPAPPDFGCYSHMFIVTPVNQAGNGTQAEVTLQLTDTNVMSVSSVSTSNGFILTMSSPVCSGELSIIDLNTGETVEDTELTISVDTIAFTATLVNNRRYNITVEAANHVNPATVSHLIINMHDIEDVAVRMNSANDTEVVTVYSEGSTARGALFDFVFIDDNGDVNFTRSGFLALDRNTSLHLILPFNLYPGQYRVFVYDIESDGTLSNGVGYPAGTDELIISDNGQVPSPQPSSVLEDCLLTTSYGSIVAKCVLPANSMVSGIQMVAQLTSSDKVHKLHVNQSMDLQTPVTVEVESGVYQVAIFAIKEETGIVGSSAYVSEVNVNTDPQAIKSQSDGGTVDLKGLILASIATAAVVLSDFL